MMNVVIPSLYPGNTPMKICSKYARFLSLIVSLLVCSSSLSNNAVAAVFSPPEGIFVSSSITTAAGGHSIQKEDMAKDFVAGVLVRVAWSDLEKSPGVYDFTVLDNELARADQYNTQVTLGIVNGPSAPAWLESQGVAMMPFVDNSDGQLKRLPLLWDAVYLNYWKNFIAALGARYNSHPRVVLVHMTHATGNGFEMQLPESTEVQIPWEDVGYSEANVIEAWEQVVDAFAFAFPDKPLDLEVHPVLRSDAVAQAVATYGSETLGDQFGIFAAWWSQDNASKSYPGMNQLLIQSAASTFATVQMVCSATNEPDRMGSGGIDTAVSLALQNGIRYFEIWNQDIRNTSFQTLLQQTATTLNALNDKPTITGIANQTVNEDAAAITLSFQVSDAETNAGNLTITATASDTALFPSANLVVGGSGGNRTVSLTPKSNMSGAAVITLIVSDGSQTSSSTFNFTVNAVNDLPTIGTVSSQTFNEDYSSSTQAFSVSDVETDKNSLSVTASSSNPTLFPATGIALGTSGNNRTVKLTPAANQNGTATLTLTVSDGVATASSSFQVTVNAVNDAPTLTSLADISVNEDTTSATKSFTIGDAETSTSSLTVSASSSDGGLLPVGNVVFGGSGSSRTLTVTPGSNRNGSATLTVIVSDGSASARSSFNVTVNAVNDAPTLSTISAASVNEDTATRALSFSISDSETASSSLSLTASSSNTALIANANIELSGTDANRTVKLTPAADKSGTATITLTASDGTATTKMEFTVTVNAVNDAPVISTVNNLTLAKNSTSSAIAFTISDVETSSSSLTVSATSGNENLLPSSQITLGGSGGNRTVTLKPNSNKTGTATITLKVSDGTTSSTSKFTVTVQ